MIDIVRYTFKIGAGSFDYKFYHRGMIIPTCIQAYCEIIFIRWTFNFVYFMGRTDPYKIFIHLPMSNIQYNLKTTNSPFPLSSNHEI